MKRSGIPMDRDKEFLNSTNYMRISKKLLIS